MGVLEVTIKKTHKDTTTVRDDYCWHRLEKIKAFHVSRFIYSICYIFSLSPYARIRHEAFTIHRVKSLLVAFVSMSSRGRARASERRTRVLSSLSKPRAASWIVSPAGSFFLLGNYLTCWIDLDRSGSIARELYVVEGKSASERASERRAWVLSSLRRALLAGSFHRFSCLENIYRSRSI
jgi:hypothetical protein